MTQSVPIVPGGIYFVTRRTLHRQFRLRPGADVNRLFEYCLAVGARRYEVEIIASVTLGNHWHGVLRDPKGNHRQLLQWVHAMIARYLNVAQGTRDSFWSGERNKPVLLADHDAVLRKIVYVIANPVSSGLVESSAEWPGFGTLPEDLARERTPVERPPGFFDIAGDLPATATLRLHKPIGFGFDAMTDEEFRILVGNLVAETELEFGAERCRTGRRVLGVEHVLSQGIFDSPSTPHSRSTIAPRVATQVTELRVAILSWFKDFAKAYREAFRRLRENQKKPVFPFGTDLMRRVYGHACSPPPPDFPLAVPL